MSLLYRRALSRASESKQRLNSPSQLTISIMGNTNCGQVIRTMARKLVCLPEPSPQAHESHFGESTFGPSEKSSFADFRGSEQAFPTSNSFDSSEPSPVEPSERPGRGSIRPIMTKEQLEMALSRESLTLEKEDKRSSLKAMTIDMSKLKKRFSRGVVSDFRIGEESPELRMRALSPPPEHFRRRKVSGEGVLSPPASPPGSPREPVCLKNMLSRESFIVSPRKSRYGEDLSPPSSPRRERRSRRMSMSLRH
ncbi:hypothetical protein SCHPADRAFT_935770 [Schizopora paradoxa]|uniref:Uncharacterized protein n=1 Tax=Schizopora paradoxa TaxID=27342 RepID=A0A0H2SPE6_9AGAM|nr:hypothetical protein SCHPADRAFT_935770 [Schizopora paradoxa]